MMEDCLGFQAQIASVIEILANSAVVEICKLVDAGYAALRSQMDLELDKSQKENDALRKRLQEMDVKMRSCEKRLRRSRQREEMYAVHLKPAEVSSNQQLLAPSLPAPEDVTFHPVSQQEETKLLVEKQENKERESCSLDVKVEVNISTDCAGLSSAQDTSEDTPPAEILIDTSANTLLSSSQSSPSPTDATIDLTFRPRAKRKPIKAFCNSFTAGSVGVQSPGTVCKESAECLPGSDLKPNVQTDDTKDDTLPPSHLAATVKSEEPSSDLNLELDLAWMQERVSHLGAAYAVAQLGLGNTNTGHASSTFPSQGEAEAINSPLTVTSGAHEVAAFASSFDMAAVAAAVIAAPHPPPPSRCTGSAARTSSQRRPPRNGAAFAKDLLVCTVCHLVFPNAATLEQHQQVHAGERPYTCPHCGKGFAQPNNLRVHLLVHTGERRYRCTLCGKSFISSSHLKRHRTVHTQEKPYSCSRCGQSFSQMCSVRRHRQQSQCGM